MRRAASPAAALCLAALVAACGADTPTEKTNIALVEDQYAYHVGVLAYLYGYPLVDQYRKTHNETMIVQDASLQPEFDPMRGLGYFEVLNLLLRKSPVEPGTQALMDQFDQIGVGPSVLFDQARLSPARKRGLERAIRDARALLEAAEVSGEAGEFDYLARAARHRAERLNP